MKISHNGWHLQECRRKSGDNFGGKEFWWEIKYRHDDGREAFATGATKEIAVTNVEERMTRMDNPPPPASVSESDFPF